MSDTLYLQLDANIEVHHPHVYLQDIAKMSCTNPRLLNRLRVLPVINLDPGKPGRYVMSVMDLIELIRQKQPDLEITPLGETDFILTYEKAAPRHLVIHFLKVAFICLASFFGEPRMAGGPAAPGTSGRWTTVRGLASDQPADARRRRDQRR